MLHRRTRTALIAAIGAVATIALGVACGTRNLSDSASSGSSPTSQAGGDCAPGRAGCPCDVPGQTIDCGTVVSRSGDYVMCSMGSSVCESGAWSACKGDSIQAKSLGSASIDPHTHHVRTKLVSCPQTADGGAYDCDPNRCPPVVEGAGDVDAAGAIESDAGVSLPQHCTALQCDIVPSCACPNGVATTITGRVWDPAGVNPLNNVSVYIPNDPAAALPAFAAGPSCDPCSYAAGLAPPDAVAVTQTAPDGSFTLPNVPSGANIPIVVQSGKWRRKITLPTVTPCMDNKIPDPTLRLPRNQTEGDLPQIAFVAGGGPDDLECLLLKMGIDPQEFGSLFLNANRRVHYYNSPDKPGPVIDPAYGINLTGDYLWINAGTLRTYDLVMIACDGNDYTDFGRQPTGYTNMTNYANGGGRVFLSHYSRSWMMNNPSWNTVAAGGWSTSSTLTTPLAATIDTTTTKGQQFAQWLAGVGATSAPDTINLQTAHQSSIDPLSAGVQSWMSAPGDYPTAGSIYSPNFSFDTPLGTGTDGGGGACGRVVYSDYHVSSSDTGSNTQCSSAFECGFGETCNITGTPQECNQLACDPTWPIFSACGDEHFTCQGGTAGSCSCNTTTDCQSMNAGTCVNGTCSQSTCYLNSECTAGPQTCTGTAGTCTSYACQSNTDCDKGEYCFNGTCNGCLTDWDCPGKSTCPTGVTSGTGTCQGNSSYAPEACERYLPITPQEAALEFEFFDLSSCVASVAPPPAVTLLSPVSFTEDLVSQCSGGEIPVWRELDWYAEVPPTASIEFDAQTAAQPADGGAPDWSHAEKVVLATVTTSNPVGGQPGRVLIDTGPGGGIADAGPVDAAPSTDGSPGPGAFQVASPQVSSLADLRLTITLNPTCDTTASPVLNQWIVKWDCVPSE